MENINKILSSESLTKLRESADAYLKTVEEVIRVTTKEQADKIKELKDENEELLKMEERYELYKETYYEDNCFIAESIEDQRKLEALKRNWEHISFEDIDKLCKF